IRTSRISERVTPLVSAPLIWARNSFGRFRIESIARLSMLRVLRGSSSRPQIAPQQYSVTSSWNGLLNSSTFFSALVTKASPITAFLISNPLSCVVLSMLFPGRFFGISAAPKTTLGGRGRIVTPSCYALIRAGDTRLARVSHGRFCAIDAAGQPGEIVERTHPRFAGAGTQSRGGLAAADRASLAPGRIGDRLGTKLAASGPISDR